MTLKVRILRCLRRLFIILVSLTMTRFSEKMLISTRCIHAFMSNLIKQSWTDSNIRILSLNVKSAMWSTILYRGIRTSLVFRKSVLGKLLKVSILHFFLSYIGLRWNSLEAFDTESLFRSLILLLLAPSLNYGIGFYEYVNDCFVEERMQVVWF